MKTALVILVTLANLLGSWPCCCAIAASRGGASRENAGEVRKSCPKCHQNDNPVPAEPAKPCPCKDKIRATVPPAEVPTSTLVSLAALEPVGVSDAVPGPADRFVVTVGEFVCELPFMPARVRLRAHHVLRC